ncbi:DUF1616 domain-containing protein [Halobacteriaceae archaeon GCM10025711]
MELHRVRHLRPSGTPGRERRHRDDRAHRPYPPVFAAGDGAVRRRNRARPRRRSGQRVVADAAPAAPLQAESRFDATLNRFIVVSMVVLVASVAFAGVMSPADESFSEFYLLTENESGDLVLADYPNDFGSTADDTLHLGIENQEGHGVEYTVVVVQQRLDDQGEIATQNELDRLTASVGAGESTTIEYTPRPSMTGDGTRVQFLLYRDAPPENPTPENAYRELHIWNDG